MLKGYRTIIVNALILGGTAALQSLASVDWIEQVGPVGAIGIIALINMGLRAITDTPMGKAE